MSPKSGIAVPATSRVRSSKRAQKKSFFSRMNGDIAVRASKVSISS